MTQTMQAAQLDDESSTALWSKYARVVDGCGAVLALPGVVVPSGSGIGERIAK
jgi:hypothetical protein